MGSLSDKTVVSSINNLVVTSILSAGSHSLFHPSAIFGSSLCPPVASPGFPHTVRLSSPPAAAPGRGRTSARSSPAPPGSDRSWALCSPWQLSQTL